MPLKQRLDQRQLQKLILAPALQQAIKLLPLTNLEITEVIDEELAQNPMLELEEESEDHSAEGTGEMESPEGSPLAGETAQNSIIPEEANVQPPDLDEGQEVAELDSYFEQYFDEGFRAYPPEKKDVPAMENFIARVQSLWDRLDWQANMTFFDPEDKKIAEVIIGNINEDGYLTVSEEEAARMAGADLERVMKVRAMIRMFDPVGVASLDLKEALLIQMDNFNLTNDITRTIITQHLPLLEKSDYPQLSKVLGIPLAEVKYHMEVIKRLDPAPGRRYSQERTVYVVPDIIVTKENQDWKVALNNEGLPRLRLNKYYRRLLHQASRSNPETLQFLRDKMKKALWFLRSLDQRDRTIYRVAKYIVDKQKDFFEKGLEYIRPLTLMEIAQEIGVHESTVGRVVANKHLVSPEGVLSLKYFFHKSLSGQMGEDVSSLMVKDHIRKLVEGEDKEHPLSDIEIDDLLSKQNLKIARRTVAKYRQQLGIAPSHIRKRKSMMEGNHS